MSHTPGPWKAEEVEPYCLELVHGEDNRKVPGVSLDLDDAPVPDYNRIVYANADLIAAAPEMYKCLKQLCANNPNNMPTEELNKLYMDCENVLIQAEGKS